MSDASKIDDGPWAREIKWAAIICAQFGCSVTPADLAKYEIAKVKGDGISLVIYPHTTTGTRNQHARVRDNGSKDKRRAQLVMGAMNHGIGLTPEEEQDIRFSRTFSQKNHSPLWNDIEEIRALIAASKSEAHHG